jgi:TonB family protein
MTYSDERMDRFVVASAILHGALFTVVILSPRFLPNLGPNWGSQTGGGQAINVKISGGISGISLPKPDVVQEDAPANDSPGFYKSEPAPTPPPDKTAEPIPEPKAPLKTTPVPKPKPAAQTSKSPAPETPSNAIPYGQGGRPSLSYGAFSTGAGEGGIQFGDAAFGDRYSAYVNNITRAISGNWLRSLVDANVQKAPRVYMSFTISRDGSVTDVSVKQSSGIPSLDRSAQRAILASNPLQPLPSDYRGGSVTVSFYFEYSR